LQARASPSPNLEDDIVVFISFEHLIKYVEERKSSKSEASSSADSNASEIDKFKDPYKDIWRKH
jgi:hypothetical protein